MFLPETMKDSLGDKLVKCLDEGAKSDARNSDTDEVAVLKVDRLVGCFEYK